MQLKTLTATPHKRISVKKGTKSMIYSEENLSDTRLKELIYSHFKVIESNFSIRYFVLN
jgi:hypothetical protein